MTLAECLLLRYLYIKAVRYLSDSGVLGHSRFVRVYIGVDHGLKGRAKPGITGRAHRHRESVRERAPGLHAPFGCHDAIPILRRYVERAVGPLPISGVIGNLVVHTSAVVVPDLALIPER